VRDGLIRWRGRGEEGENKISSPSLDRTAQRWWRNLTEQVEKTQRKRSLLSGERRELFGEKKLYY
jgi:hypothetical protein